MIQFHSLEVFSFPVNILCTLHGCRLFSEEIYNEDAAQTMFFQSQASLTEKKPTMFFFLFPKKGNGVQKSQSFKIWVQIVIHFNHSRSFFY